MGGSSSRSYSSTVNRGYSSMFVREFSSDLKSRAIFDKMGGIIEEDGEAMVAKVGHVYHFGVRAEKGGDLTYFTMDLKDGWYYRGTRRFHGCKSWTRLSLWSPRGKGRRPDIFHNGPQKWLRSILGRIGRRS